MVSICDVFLDRSSERFNIDTLWFLLSLCSFMFLLKLYKLLFAYFINL